jgi:hypothetical protein
MVPVNYKLDIMSSGSRSSKEPQQHFRGTQAVYLEYFYISLLLVLRSASMTVSGIKALTCCLVSCVIWSMDSKVRSGEE